MRNTALARLAILAALTCTACDVLDPAEDEVDETRAGYAQALYQSPFAEDDRGLVYDLESRVIALVANGSYTLDGAEISAAELGQLLAENPDGTSYFTSLEIDDDVPMSQALPLFQMLDVDGFEGVPIEGIYEFHNFDSGVETGESLPGDAFFRGTPGEYEFPAFVSYQPDTETCRTTFNGSAMSSDQLHERAFEKLDMIVMREGGPDAVLSNPEIMEALVATIQTPPDTPWRCVAGATFNLTRSGWPAIRYELVTED